jgi:hypothetical protein
MNIDFQTQDDIHVNIIRIDELFKTGVFSANEARNPFFQSAFIEVMIRLNDLLQKAKNVQLSVTFTDDVTIIGNVKNITDLVNMVRNAVCHSPSKNHIVDDVYNIKSTYNITFGIHRTSVNIGSNTYGSNYADDISLQFGKHTIYIYRHIHRAFVEVSENLIPLLNPPFRR